MLVLIACIARTVFAEKFILPQFHEINKDVHPYDDITSEDIWHYQVADKLGVVNITPEIYQSQIYNQHSNWFISILKPGTAQTADNDYSTFVMKGLYFLKRDHPKLNVGYVIAREELIREAFDYHGFPQQFFITNGLPYAMPWDAWQINKFEEFMIRYEAIATQGSYHKLYPLATGYMIYFEYYQRHLGEFGKVFFQNYLKYFIHTYDEELQHRWLYKDFMYWYHDAIFEANIKTAGRRLFASVVLPLICLTSFVLFLMCRCCCGCCRKQAVKPKID